MEIKERGNPNYIGDVASFRKDFKEYYKNVNVNDSGDDCSEERGLALKANRIVKKIENGDYVEVVRCSECIKVSGDFARTPAEMCPRGKHPKDKAWFEYCSEGEQKEVE